jgi:hypothetical protein
MEGDADNPMSGITRGATPYCSRAWTNAEMGHRANAYAADGAWLCLTKTDSLIPTA